MTANDKYMRQCLLLAARGMGNVAPNPMVGCVIVHDGKVIGEGYHMQYGGPHAEVNAINAVADKSLLTESTVYVNLEPCSHHGKTPPCSDLLVNYKVKKVVIGNLDTNPLVAGKGIEKLKAAGIEVVVDVLKDDCRELNKRFFTFQEKKRPYVILKWAQTKDGFISRKAPFTKEENQISGEESKMLLHLWRGQEQAILVGTNTALIDDPSLTVRLVKGKNPVRVVIDKDLKIKSGSAIFSKDAHTIVFTSGNNPAADNVKFIQIDFAKNVMQQILEKLYEEKIISVIVEGGTRTLQGFIDANLWDEARVFTSEKTFEEGLKAPKITGNKISEMLLDGDSLVVILKSK